MIVTNNKNQVRQFKKRNWKNNNQKQNSKQSNEQFAQTNNTIIRKGKIEIK